MDICGAGSKQDTARVSIHKPAVERHSQPVSERSGLCVAVKTTNKEREVCRSTSELFLQASTWLTIERGKGGKGDK